MQIAAAQSSPWSSLPMFNRPATPDAPQAAANGESADVSVPASSPTDTISLHAPADAAALAQAQMQSGTATPEVFAEIWKNGMKIGAVYTNGQAVLPGGLGGGIGGGGAMFAQLRAEELSRQVGGEVRYVNIAALRVEQTRTQLRAAYGV